MEEKGKEKARTIVKRGLAAIAIMGLLCAGILSSRTIKAQDNVQVLEFNSAIFYPMLDSGRTINVDKASPCKVVKTKFEYNQETKDLAVTLGNNDVVHYETSGPINGYQLMGKDKYGAFHLFSNMKTIDSVNVVVMSSEDYLVIFSETEKCQTVRDLP